MNITVKLPIVSVCSWLCLKGQYSVLSTGWDGGPNGFKTNLWRWSRTSLHVDSVPSANQLQESMLSSTNQTYIITPHHTVITVGFTFSIVPVNMHVASVLSDLLECDISQHHHNYAQHRCERNLFTSEYALLTNYLPPMNHLQHWQ